MTLFDNLTLVDLHTDPLMAIIFELEYLIQWTSDKTAPPVTHSIVVGWTSRVVFPPTDLSLNGARNIITLQRGPSKTLRHSLVYGDEALSFTSSTALVANPAGEYKQQQPFRWLEEITLNVGLFSPEFAGWISIELIYLR